MPVDTVVMAIGNGANPLLTRATPGLSTNKWGYILADPKTGRTSLSRVYAGGDITNGGSTVVQAVADGMRAADAIHRDIGS